MKFLLVFVSMLVALSSCDEQAVKEFIDGNVKFTAKLYKELQKTEKGNFIVSPFSAEVVLALTRAGAKGPTAEEFTTALNLPSPQTTQEAFKTIFASLKKSNDNLKLSSANKLYLADIFQILDSYKSIATNDYDAGVENVDFTKNNEAASKINSWVESQTNNRIKNLISPDSLGSSTALVLVNALYFKGQWLNMFDTYFTSKEKFYKSANDATEVDMMGQEDNFKYYENNEAQFLELPYEGGDELSMTVVLPKEKEGLTSVEQNLENFLKPQPLRYEKVRVRLPKWKVESEIDFVPILKTLGLNQVFTKNADLSGIGGAKNLLVDEVKQKAFIEVDENGTEAAAATYVGIQLTSGMVSPPRVFPFVADHPFLYVIKQKGVVLFAGKITSPL